MASGKVEVELRLLLTKMREDLQKAKAEIKSAMGQAGGQAANDPVAATQEKRARAVNKTNISLKEQARLIREGKNLGPNPNINLGAGRTGASGGSSWSTTAGGGLATLPPGAGGAAAGKAGGNTLAGMFNSLINFQMSPIAAMATKVGAALATVRVAIGLVGFAARTATEPIMRLANMLSNQFRQAAEAARSMYARQLQSGGLPGGFVAGRSLMAEMLGVGEGEIMQYGKAVAYLNEKVRFAQNVYTQTTPQLASASYELRALNNDFKALAMLIASEFAPAVRQMVYVLRQVVEFFGTTFAKLIAGAFKKTLDMLVNFFSGPIGLYLKKLVSENAGAFTPGAAPGVAASSSRMPASAWEKMGLVLGNGGKNPAQATAENTKKMVGQLEKISKNLMPRGERGLQMFNNPIPAMP